MSVNKQKNPLGSVSGHSNNAFEHGSDTGSLKVGSQTCLSGERAGQETDKHKSFAGKIFQGVKSLWSTRQLENVENDKELHIKTTLRELIVYIIFLAILCVLTFGMASPINFYYTSALTSLFSDSTTTPDKGEGVGFSGIGSMGDFWDVMEGPIMDSIYWETWYNDNNVSEDQLGSIYFENKVLGVPRLRQVRVRKDSCTVHPKFRDIASCYAQYSSSAESKEPFGIYAEDQSNLNDTAFFYQSSSEIKGSSVDGTHGSYNGGGYVKNLGHLKADTLAVLENLKTNLWLDRGTRAVFLDLTVYNANINLFCQIRLITEFPAIGGATTSSMFRTVKLIRYVTSMDYFVLACEIMFIFFILYYTVEEVLEIRVHKLSYFTTNFWNILDVVVIIISYICILFNFYRMIKVDQMLEGLLSNVDQFPDFEFLCFWQVQFNNAIALTVFLSWIKIFKYISFNKTMTQLSATLTNCAKDVAGFAVMFYIVFFAYAQLGYLLFGSLLQDYSTFPTALFTLFRVILGDFDFVSLESSSKILGPVYFISYVFFVFFVLLNMFLAIINDTYSDVKADIDINQSDIELGSFFKERYEKVLSKMSIKRDKIIDIQKAMLSADKDNDKKLDFEEWRNALRARGYSDIEIEAFFAKYDVDGDRVLSEFEQDKIRNDLNIQAEELDQEYETMNKEKAALEEEAEEMRRKANIVTEPEFNILVKRVDTMEYSIGTIVTRIDRVLSRLEDMEKAKIKRREGMLKILDSINNSTNLDDESKRHQLEKYIREEVDKWDDSVLASNTVPARQFTATPFKKL